MTIGVMLKGALGNDRLAIVPLDTSNVQPTHSSIIESCSKELKALFPFEPVYPGYEVVGIESIIAKIIAVNSCNVSNQLT